jgi:hypothetical protein
MGRAYQAGIRNAVFVDFSVGGYYNCSYRYYYSEALMIHKLLILVIFLICPFAIHAEKIDEETLLGFLSGKYDLIGKRPGSNVTYTGTIEISYNENKKCLDLLKVIDGKKIKGTAKIEYALSDKIPVLRVQFTDNTIIYEGLFLWRSDLDNYGRITGQYWPKDDPAVEKPGLEAYFILQE